MFDPSTAFNTASKNAARNNSPYGMLVTTTPGMLTTDEGTEAFTMKETATPFSERWYDLTKDQIFDIINSNTNITKNRPIQCFLFCIVELV